MNRSNIPDPDLDKLLKEALKDDLPPAAEAKMNQQFLNLKHTLEHPESLTEAEEWPWMRGLFQKGILTVASAVMLILGLIMQLSGSPGALANSIERLKVTVTVSESLNRTVFMDCTILKPETGGENTSYHVLWRANGDTRVDMFSTGSDQTIWILDETISFAGSDGGSVRSMPLKTLVPGPVWQTAMEFRTPALLAKQLEEIYRLMQTGERSGTGSGEFLIIGRKDKQVVEITIDARTYLPKVLKKYVLDSGRTNEDQVSPMEVRFLWNQPISDELFVSGLLVGKR